MNWEGKRRFFNLNNNQKGVLFMVLCSLCTSAGQIFWKAASTKIDFFNPLSFLNFNFLLGGAVYALGMGLMLMAFKKGDLSLLYPIVAMSYVWVSIASPLFFPSDSMNSYKWVGVIVILFSVSLLGFGSSRIDSKNRDNLKIDFKIEEKSENKSETKSEYKSENKEIKEGNKHDEINLNEKEFESKKSSTKVKNG
ncbi:MAG: hypothetical protein KKA62_04795 [Nanoarchaeota archaeon]|nr:hypothetical protein [Nanoarchaeota archaeon]MBU1977239.1 hypothetical protein [Nanoarchaeota archaeon]